MIDISLGNHDVVISDHQRIEGPMLTINLKDAKTSFSSLVNEAIKGDFVTITRHGKPVAVLVSIEAAELARKALATKRTGLVAYLRTYPGDVLSRNRAASRDVEL